MGQGAAPQPSANQGFEAAGLQQLGALLPHINKLLQAFQPNSEPWSAVNDFIKKIGKFVPAGTDTPASQRQLAERMQQNAAQQNKQMQVLQQMRAGAGGGAGGAGGAAGGMPGAPAMGAGMGA